MAPPVVRILVRLNRNDGLVREYVARKNVSLRPDDSMKLAEVEIHQEERLEPKVQQSLPVQTDLVAAATFY